MVGSSVSGFYVRSVLWGETLVCYDSGHRTFGKDPRIKVDMEMQIGRRVTSVLTVVLGVLTGGLLAVTDAAAQMQAWEDNGYVTINYGYQVGDRSFGESLSAAVYDETATYSVSHSSSSGGFFDVGGGVRVWRNLAAGVAITSFAPSAGATVSGSVPHPLFFNRDRDGSVARTDLDHKQLGIHLQAVWVMPLDEKITVAVAGGPSFFSVDQGLIQSVGAPTELGAPFNSIGPLSTTLSTVSASAVGANVGLDITYMVTERFGGRFGGGGFVRWTGGTVDIPATGGSQSINVGGFQSGIGLRIKF